MFSRNMAEEQQQEISPKESDGQNCFLNDSYNTVLLLRFALVYRLYYFISKPRKLLAREASCLLIC